MKRKRIAMPVALALALALAPGPYSASFAAPPAGTTPPAATPPAAQPGANPAAATPPAAAPLDQVLQLLGERRHSHVTFTEVHELAMLDQPLRSSGELLYDAPDRLEKRTLKPKPEDLLLEHGVLTAQRGQRRRVLSLRDYPQALPFIESIRATLAGDRAALERYFNVQFSGTVAHWTLELVPRDAALARTVQQVSIEGERGDIRTVQIRQSDGDASFLTIGPEVSP